MCVFYACVLVCLRIYAPQDGTTIGDRCPDVALCVCVCVYLFFIYTCIHKYMHTYIHTNSIYIYVLLLVKMKEKKLLKIQSLPKVLRSQAMRSTT